MARKATKARGHWVKQPDPGAPGYWRGGRIWQDGDGGLTYYIRRTVKGVPYDLSTRCTSLESALDHLVRFEKSAEAYKKASLAPVEPVVLDAGGVMLDAQRVERFLHWSRGDPKEGGKGNSAGWARKQQRVLAWWIERIGRWDLRHVSLRNHILPALDGVRDRPARIRVLKAFYGWCRKVDHSITAAEDPTLDTLSAPQAKPAQYVKSKVIPREHVLLVRDALTSPWRDALIVQAGSGWHVTELVRFAESGRIEPLPKPMRENGDAGVLICPRHKSGGEHRTRVSQEVLDAAIRLRAHGERVAKEEDAATEKPVRSWVDAFRDRYAKAIKSACRTVKCPDGTSGIPPFTPGCFRHSIATWAYEAGTDLAAISKFLGHKSPATTARFYATLATAPKVPTLI